MKLFVSIQCQERITVMAVRSRTIKTSVDCNSIADRVNEAEILGASMMETLRNQSATIEKLAEISVYSQKTLASQDERLKALEENSKTLTSLVEKRKDELLTYSEKVSMKFDAFSTEVRNALKEQGLERDRVLSSSMDGLRREMTSFNSKLADSISRLEGEMRATVNHDHKQDKEREEALRKMRDDLDNRVKDLEKSRWITYGAVAVIIIILQFIDLPSFFNLTHHILGN